MSLLIIIIYSQVPLVLPKITLQYRMGIRTPSAICSINSICKCHKMIDSWLLTRWTFHETYLFSGDCNILIDGQTTFYYKFLDINRYSTCNPSFEPISHYLLRNQVICAGRRSKVLSHGRVFEPHFVLRFCLLSTAIKSLVDSWIADVQSAFCKHPKNCMLTHLHKWQSGL